MAALSQGKSLIVEGTGEKRVASANDVFPRDASFVPVADCASMKILDEANILANISQRYAQDEIYTYAGTVLLAMNPQKPVLHLYTVEIKNAYCGGTNPHALRPHPYFLADRAFRRMLSDQKDHAIMISGESGSGKTETARIVMDFIAHRANIGKTVHGQPLQRMILEGANPLLESFGNASTVRNRNSSRFGKYNSFYFNSCGDLTGASISTFLLESSRVVTFDAEKERTFHVFYEMLHLPSIQPQYHIVVNSEDCNRHPMDKPNFDRLLGAFKIFNFSDAFIDSVFSILAGIVHLCRLSFEDDESDLAEVDWDVSETSLSIACELLSLDQEEVLHRILFREVVVSPNPKRHSFYSIRRSADQATNASQAFIKAIYARLFNLLVQKMNVALGSCQKTCGASISILDIYGFEDLDTNSLEQLCINFANEGLQQFFASNVLLAEQELYKSEGLSWKDVEVTDCTPVTETIKSIFSLLDNQGILASRNQQGDDRKFTQDVHAQLKHSSVLCPPKISRRSTLDKKAGFLITHFAGVVAYCTENWMEKNNARLTPELECLLRDSSNTLLASLADKDGCERDSGRFTSVGKKYLNDTRKLLQTLKASGVTYIRCFKPNHEQSRKFDGGCVALQMLQSGTCDLVRVMHMGFPYRCHISDLHARFAPALLKLLRAEDPRLFVQAVMHALGIDKHEWALGKSYVFMKPGKWAALDDLVLSPDIVRRLKLYVTRCKFRRCVRAVGFCHWLLSRQRRARREYLLRTIYLYSKLCSRARRWAATARLNLQKKRVCSACIKLQICVKVTVALNRWVKRARILLKQTRIAICISKLYRASQLYRRLFAWLHKCRKNLREKRVLRSFYQLERAANICTCLDWWLKTAKVRLEDKRRKRIWFQSIANSWIVKARWSLREQRIDYFYLRLKFSHMRDIYCWWREWSFAAQRMNLLCRKLKYAVIIRLRLNRWLGRARSILRQKRIDTWRLKLWKTARLGVFIDRWVGRAKLRLLESNCRKLRNCVILRVRLKHWARRARVEVKLTWLFRLVLVSVTLSRYQRRWVTRRKRLVLPVVTFDDVIRRARASITKAETFLPTPVCSERRKRHLDFDDEEPKRLRFAPDVLVDTVSVVGSLQQNSVVPDVPLHKIEEVLMDSPSPVVESCSLQCMPFQNSVVADFPLLEIEEVLIDSPSPVVESCGPQLMLVPYQNRIPVGSFIVSCPENRVAHLAAEITAEPPKSKEIIDFSHNSKICAIPPQGIESLGIDTFHDLPCKRSSPISSATKASTSDPQQCILDIACSRKRPREDWLEAPRIRGIDFSSGSSCWSWQDARESLFSPMMVSNCFYDERRKFSSLEICVDSSACEGASPNSISIGTDPSPFTRPIQTRQEIMLQSWVQGVVRFQMNINSVKDIAEKLSAPANCLENVVGTSDEEGITQLTIESPQRRHEDESRTEFLS